MRIIKLKKKTNFILMLVILLQIIFFYLTYLSFNEEKKLSVSLRTDKIDKKFKTEAEQIFDLINHSQNYFNHYILFRELQDLSSYNESLIKISYNLEKLLLNKDQSKTLRLRLKKNIALNEKLIELKFKIDSLRINDKQDLMEINLDSILKIPNYKFEEVLKSVEFETNKKIDSVKKKGLFSRLGSAVKGDVDIQKEKTNSIIKLNFGNKIVVGDLKEQFKNVLLESQKHYNDQFKVLEKNLSKIQLTEKELIYNNSELLKLYYEINNKLKYTIDSVLIENSNKINQQINFNKRIKFYFFITVFLIILLLMMLLLKYANNSFEIQQQLIENKEQISNDLFLKNKVISILTHEIKTPVNIISLYATMLRKKDCFKEELVDFLDTITYTSNTLKHISNQAVELVKENNNESVLNLEKIDLSKESLLIVNSLKTFASSKNIKVEFDNQLPVSFEVQYDKAKFYQLVYNLVGNAIKFANSTVKISTKLEREGDILKFLFIVKDDGVGISIEDQKHIFDLEYQSKNNKSFDVLSFGLGLHICKNIISVSNGEILVSSELDKGTTIFFSLKFLK